MRPYWKGYLKLALVSCPIALHAACSSAERIAFRQINKATGNRLRHGRTEGERIKALEREVREFRQANENLRKASAYFAAAELDRPFKK